MANCGLIQTDYFRGCDVLVSGIRKLYFSNYSGATTYTYDALGVVTGATGTLNYYEYQLKEETGELTTNMIVNPGGGTSWEQLVTMVFQGNRQEVRNRINELTKAVTTCIVLDENDQYWLLGAVRGLSPNAGNQAWGVTATDVNEARVTFRTVESTPPTTISSTFAPDILP